MSKGLTLGLALGQSEPRRLPAQTTGGKPNPSEFIIHHIRRRARHPHHRRRAHSASDHCLRPGHRAVLTPHEQCPASRCPPRVLRSLVHHGHTARMIGHDHDPSGHGDGAHDTATTVTTMQRGKRRGGPRRTRSRRGRRWCRNRRPVHHQEHLRHAPHDGTRPRSSLPQARPTPSARAKRRKDCKTPLSRSSSSFAMRWPCRASAKKKAGVTCRSC